MPTFSNATYPILIKYTFFNFKYIVALPMPHGLTEK